MPKSKLLRSLLFVPGNSESKLKKAAGAPSDAVIIDWEDAILPAHKSTARHITIDALKNCREHRQLVLIRVNPGRSKAFQEDCAALSELLPGGLVLAKCGSPDDVLSLVKFLDRVDPNEQCSVYPLIESTRGVLRAPEIAACSWRVAGLLFGAEDFSAEAGIHRTEDEIELLYARSAVVTAARACGAEVYDSPCMQFRNLDQVRNSARRARNLGFSGQMTIHPAQVPVVNETFSPSEKEVKEARRILEGFAQQGAGVTAVEGQVVDEPILRQARRILELARRSTGGSV